MSAAREQPLPDDAAVRDTIERIYRSESRRVLATLIRLLGDIDRAEEALHDAFRAALEQWPRSGLPANPRAWLVSAGRFKAIDRLRRESRFEPLGEAEAARHAMPAEMESWEGEQVEDDRLRLIFTCCHPALAVDAQIALTLREVCGLSTEEIARAYLVSAPTLAQRIVRAKAKIRDARIPYQIPTPTELPERLDAVLHVIYLVFNEGYSATSGESVTRASLSGEAIRLGRLLVELLPAPDAVGLLALMLLQESRRDARSTPAGELIVLEEQDRTRWNRAQIREGTRLVNRALQTQPVGVYTVQAAIAAVHGEADSLEATDWTRIVALYDALLDASPSPVVALNRAVALAMRDGPEAGLAIIEALMGEGALANYHLAHAARAELNLRLGRSDAAREAFAAALALARQEPERRHLERRLALVARDG
jgi:RNA polymerase sigma-70 factor, ECF subfamily